MDFRQSTAGILRELSMFVNGALNASAGEILLLLLAIVSLIGLMIGLLVLIRGRKRQEAMPATVALENTVGLRGRLERLEKALNDLRTESARMREFYTQDLEYIHDELGNVLEHLGKDRPENLRVSTQLGQDRNREKEGLADSSEVKSALDQVRSEHAVEDVTALSQRLVKTRSGIFHKIKKIFSSHQSLSQEMLDELEALLVGSDLGVKTSVELIERVKSEIDKGQFVDEEALIGMLREEVLEILESGQSALGTINPERQADGPYVILLIGVNGVGKTTTIAKLARRWNDSGKKVLMVAADTFRAAAVQQLEQWGQALEVKVISGSDQAKPATVVFDAMEEAKKGKYDVVLIDTAGRLHNKSNLMQELEGIKNVLNKSQAKAPHQTLLVLDGSTGQNAVQQAKEFNQAVPLTGLVVTKLDGTPKGGIVVAIKHEMGIPVRYIGVGEAAEDLREFEADDFVDALFDQTGLAEEPLKSTTESHNGRRRKRSRKKSLWNI